MAFIASEPLSSMESGNGMSWDLHSHPSEEFFLQRGSGVVTRRNGEPAG